MLEIENEQLLTVPIKRAGQDAEVVVRYTTPRTKQKVRFRTQSIMLRAQLKATEAGEQDAETLVKIQDMYEALGREIVTEVVSGISPARGMSALEVAAEYLPELFVYVGQRAMSESQVEIDLGKLGSRSDSSSADGSAASTEEPAST